MHIVCLAALLALAHATNGVATSGRLAPDSALLILANGDNTLRIVNPASLKVTATLPVGPDPHEVIASPDGSTARATVLIPLTMTTWHETLVQPAGTSTISLSPASATKTSPAASTATSSG